MTNKEWLDYLAHNAPDELAAWFDAEHAEHRERALDGDTESENADSRDKLEADMRELMRNLYEIGYKNAKLNYGILGKETKPRLFDFDESRGAKFIELLNRQAAITERETTKRHEFFCETCEAVSDKQIAELTAERDELQERVDYNNRGWEEANIGWAETCAEAEKLQMECDEYRSKFGKCLDYADAIHALMDDEGMA